MQVLLRISNGKANVRNVRLKSDTIIGRSPECQLKVASNQISRRHCQIVIRDSLVAIKDLGSANGTFVNGRQIPAEVEIPLTPGTRVMLGPLQFTVEYDLPGMAASATAATAAVPVVAVTAAPRVAAPVLDAEPNYDTVNAPLPFIPPPVPSLPVPPATIVPSSPVIVADRQPASPPMPDEPEGIPDFSATMPGNVPDDAADFSPATVIARSPFAEFVPPEAFSLSAEVAAGADEVDAGNFNFGIFASSSSGIIVETVSLNPIPSAAGVSEPAKSGPSKPAKKGLLSMFGWGKKKPATASPPSEPAAVETVQAAPALNQSLPAGDADAVETLSFELPTAAESATETEAETEVETEAETEAPSSADSPDGSLQNFFNNFK